MRTIKVLASLRTISGTTAWGEELEVQVADSISEIEEDLIIENAVNCWKDNLMLEWDYMDHLSLQAEEEIQTPKPDIF